MCRTRASTPPPPPKKKKLPQDRREEARNSFESYLYRLRDLLNDGERREISEKFGWEPPVVI